MQNRPASIAEPGRALTHMPVNRMLLAAPRELEMITQALLDRLYRGWIGMTDDSGKHVEILAGLNRLLVARQMSQNRRRLCL
jgi:hypothetical protein